MCEHTWFVKGVTEWKVLSTPMTHSKHMKVIAYNRVLQLWVLQKPERTRTAKPINVQDIYFIQKHSFGFSSFSGLTSPLQEAREEAGQDALCLLSFEKNRAFYSATIWLLPTCANHHVPIRSNLCSPMRLIVLDVPHSSYVPASLIN